MSAWLLGTAALGLLAGGRKLCAELELTAEEGLGYALGIAGLSAMVLLLSYSLRKRLRMLRGAGDIRHWFRLHMALGILGPLAILFHANFRLGSLNSGVALVSVLLVALSGLVGRYLYPKIHHGLDGRRLTLRELHKRAEAQHRLLRDTALLTPALDAELAAFESYALGPERNAAGTLWRFLTLALRARRVRRRGGRLLRRARPLAAEADRDQQSDLRAAERALRAYLVAIRRVAQFTAFERLFSLWHAFHLPLCVLLFAAAAVHVIAVHLY